MKIAAVLLRSARALGLALGLLVSPAALAQVPSWAEPLGASGRPGPDTRATEVPDDFPYGPAGPTQIPLDGLSLLALAGGAYGAYRLRSKIR